MKITRKRRAPLKRYKATNKWNKWRRSRRDR
jgi:hypothetical protein